MSADGYRRSICNGPPPRHVSPHVRIYRPRPFELSYLSWGRRRYGDTPIPPVMHEGWHYFLVLSGSPVLLFGEISVRVAPGTLCLAHPDCPVGHSDRPRAQCEMVTWIWRTPPVHTALRAGDGGRLLIRLDPAQRRRLVRLHAECRGAVATSNERSTLQLQSARLQLDLILLEAGEHEQPADDAFRIDLVVGYVRNHLKDRPSVKRLCDYLQISESALKRLFRTHTGKSPREFMQEWRMRWAKDHLLPSVGSVKAAAYALGYRHAADFSRAYKAHFGFSASDSLRAATTPADLSA